MQGGDDGCFHTLSAKSLQLYLTLPPHGLYPARLLCPWDSPSKNTRVCCHALLQGIFPTQGLNLCVMSPALADGFFTTNSTWEAHASFPPPKWMNTFRHNMKCLEMWSSMALWPYIYIFFLSQHLAIKIFGLNTRWACASLCIVTSSITFLSPPDGSPG